MFLLSQFYFHFCKTTKDLCASFPVMLHMHTLMLTLVSYRDAVCAAVKSSILFVAHIDMYSQHSCGQMLPLQLSALLVDLITYTTESFLLTRSSEWQGPMYIRRNLTSEYAAMTTGS